MRGTTARPVSLILGKLKGVSFRSADWPCDFFSLKSYRNRKLGTFNTPLKAQYIEDFRLSDTAMKRYG